MTTDGRGDTARERLESSEDHASAATSLEADAPFVRKQGERRTSLRTYVVTLVLLVLAPALLLGAATTWELGQAYRDAEEAGLASTAQALATALDREVEIAAATLSTLAAAPAFGAGDIAGSYPQAAAVGRTFGGWIALLDAASRQVFNTLVPLGTDLLRGSGDPFISRAITSGRLVVSDLFTGATAQRPVVAVFQPLPRGPPGRGRESAACCSSPLARNASRRCLSARSLATRVASRC